MIRTLFAASLLTAAVPAGAAPYYRAEPTAAPARSVVVTRDNVWRCGAEGCAAERASSRPAIACAALAREIGQLASFSAQERAFGAEELAACNRRARAD